MASTTYETSVAAVVGEQSGVRRWLTTLMRCSPHSQPIIADALDHYSNPTQPITLYSLPEEALVEIDSMLPNDRSSIYCRLTSLFADVYYRAILIDSGKVFERFCTFRMNDEELIDLEAALRAAS